jgi:DNA polymerase-3 subunit delta
MSAGAADRVVWLVDGDDPVLIGDRVRALIVELLEGADPALAVEEFRGEDIEVADACRTPPFLSERRVVVLRDVGAWSTEELGPLLGYLEDPSPTTALVLVAGGGRLSTKLSAAVKARGHVEGTAVASRDARNWVRERIRESTLRVDHAAESVIEAHLGEDVSRLSALLEVLLAVYGPGARVGPAEVEPYLGAAGTVAPWDLTDAIDAGNAEAALSILHRLLDAGERHPLVVLAILARHVQSMLRVESPSITTEAQAAAAMGIAKGKSTFPARKALQGARRLGPAGVAEAIGLLADAEVQLKGAMEWPGELVLEVLVARLCRLSRVPTRR